MLIIYVDYEELRSDKKARGGGQTIILEPRILQNILLFCCNANICTYLKICNSKTQNTKEKYSGI